MAGVARREVGDQAAALVRWAVEPLAGGVTEEVGRGGLRRVVGVVATGGERRDWSAVVKVLRRGEVRVGELSVTVEDERGFEYWRREADVYGSGLLDGLPDVLVAPRCYRINDTGRGGIEVWLEDLPDQRPEGMAGGAVRVGRPPARAVQRPLPDRHRRARVSMADPGAGARMAGPRSSPAG